MAWKGRYVLECVCSVCCVSQSFVKRTQLLAIDRANRDGWEIYDNAERECLCKLHNKDARQDEP